MGVNVLLEGRGAKRCTYNCVYCEIGRSAGNELTSVHYVVDVKPDAHEEPFQVELERVLENVRSIESVTFGYWGEPTLNPNLGEFLRQAAEVRAGLKRAERPTFAVFTNSSTVTRPEVREMLARFDLVLAKFDAGTQAEFTKINRPHPSVPPLDEITEGLRKLGERMERGNRLALQCLFFSSRSPHFRGNGPAGELGAWVARVARIKPDLVQIYSVARQPAEPFVFATPKQRLLAAKERLEAALGPNAKTRVRVY